MNHQYNYNSGLDLVPVETSTGSLLEAKRRLWKSLLSKKQAGVSFKRQKIIGSFIVDFYCSECNLIIEISPSSYFGAPLHKSSYERYRQNRLQNLGFKLLCLREDEILKRPEEAKQKVLSAIELLK